MHAPLEGISDCLHGNLPLPFSKWKINSPLPNVATCIRFCPVPEASLSRIIGPQMLTAPSPCTQCCAGWKIQRTRHTCWLLRSLCSTPWKGALLGWLAYKGKHLRMWRSFCPLLNPLGWSHYSKFCSTMNCYGEVSMCSYLWERQQFSITAGIHVHLKCSQQPFNIGWLLVGRTLLSSCRKLEWK